MALQKNYDNRNIGYIDENVNGFKLQFDYRKPGTMNEPFTLNCNAYKLEGTGNYTFIHVPGKEQPSVTFSPDVEYDATLRQHVKEQFDIIINQNEDSNTVVQKTTSTAKSLPAAK